MEERFEWFTTWVHQHLGLTLHSRPAQRYGEEPERFAAELERAGFLDDDTPRPSMGAAFIEDVFGITLEPELLEQPLPTVGLD
jgi:hypothetical protein